MYLSKELYNLLLEQSKKYYKETGKTLTGYRMNVWLTQLKKERPEFVELHSQVLQNVSKRVSDAYKSLFRRCKERKSGKKVKAGFPRYRNFVSSLMYPQFRGFKVERKKVSLSKIGSINFVNHREIEGQAETCSNCGNIQNMPLSERTYNCQRCGMSKDRNINASINILHKATTSGQGGSHTSGDIVRPQLQEANVAEQGTILGVSR